MLHHQIDMEKGLLSLEPEGPLTSDDFEQVAEAVDAYLEAHEKLHGILIHAHKFPGWKNFTSMLDHLRFVRDHHRRVERVAVVSDSTFLTYLPSFAKHFVSAEVKHFGESELAEAHDWLVLSMAPH